MTVKELKEPIFENYYRRIRSNKKDSYYSIKNQTKKRFGISYN